MHKTFFFEENNITSFCVYNHIYENKMKEYVYLNYKPNHE